jgi:hypothetical protein
VAGGGEEMMLDLVAEATADQVLGVWGFVFGVKSFIVRGLVLCCEGKCGFSA